MAKKKASSKKAVNGNDKTADPKKKSSSKKTTKKVTAKKVAKRVATAAKGRAKKSAVRIPFPPEVVVPGLAQPSAEGEILPEIAYYYPNPYWHDVDWAKNMVLFFDGIGMLIPNYMPESISIADEAVIAGLKEHKLFHVFQPETFIDQEAARRLESAVMGIIETGALDTLPEKDDFRLASLSMSRMGFHVAEQSAQRILKELKKRKLAFDSVDGKAFPIHYSVRHLILVLLAQILRDNGRKAGFSLLPATDSPGVVDSLSSLLSKPSMPSADRVVSLDLQAVDVDLSAVPIDEILSYREENRDAYRRYARALKLCVHELGLMPPDLQAIKLEERQEVISDLASDIRKMSKKAWRKPISFILSAAGAVWRLANDDAIGASLAGAAAVTGLTSSDVVDTGAFSYLFSAKRRFYW